MRVVSNPAPPTPGSLAGGASNGRSHLPGTSPSTSAARRRLPRRGSICRWWRASASGPSGLTPLRADLSKRSAPAVPPAGWVGRGVIEQAHRSAISTLVDVTTTVGRIEQGRVFERFYLPLGRTETSNHRSCSPRSKGRWCRTMDWPRSFDQSSQLHAPGARVGFSIGPPTIWPASQMTGSTGLGICSPGPRPRQTIWRRCRWPRSRHDLPPGPDATGVRAASAGAGFPGPWC